MEIRYAMPKTYSQTTGGVYSKWNNLPNLANDDINQFAVTDLIHGNSLTPHTPSRLTLTNFTANLPNGARVKEIRTVIRVNREYYTGYTNVCDPGAPTIKFTGADIGTQTMTGTINDNGAQYHVNTFKCDLDSSIVNSNSFGLILEFPKNRNNIRGYVRLRVVQLEIYYETPTYTVSLNKVKGEYKDDTYEINATINSTTDTRYVTSAQITIPTGFILEGYTTQGTVTQSGNVLTWTPRLSGISSDNLLLRLSTNINFGNDSIVTKTFTITEAYSNTTKNLNVTVNRYLPYSTETIEALPDAIKDEEYTYTFSFSEAQMTNIRNGSSTGYVQWKYLDLNGNVQSVSVADANWPADNRYTVTMTPTTYGKYPIRSGLKSDSTISNPLTEAYVQVIPNDTNARKVGMYILPLSTEEQNRMGKGQVYTAQTWLNITGDESYVRDWKYNFRLGVFNTGVSANISTYEYTNSNGELQEIIVDTTDYDNLTNNEILDNTVWSDAPTSPTSYNQLTVQFPYNPDYPLYIIITGDCTEASTVRSPRFTEPVISETHYYHGPEPNGTFPYPILNTLTPELTEMTIPTLATSNTLIYYDFDINLDPSDKVIRGIELTGDVNGNNIALSSKLVNQTNETRIRSKVLQYDDYDFSLGGYGDLWGFRTDDLKQFNDWEIHLTPNNTQTTTDQVLDLHNVKVTLYLEEVDHTTFKTYIDGEDLEYYGVFVTDLKVPEGLETDTDYLKINGTDLNYPIRQSIEDKTIEVDFDLGTNCDLYGNTVALRRLTQLLVNKRDKYNKPIPKRIEFSHYPDVYWEYIMEDSYKPELDINTYTVKVKLTVPSGTAYTKDDVVTTAQGYVDGLVHVNPVILLKPTNSLISITELETGQTLNLGHSTISNKSMEINCAQRKVYLIDDTTNNRIDISRHVDMNTDWFRLLGFFNFKCNGGIIQTVSFKERW